ncbi:MAG: glycosyltransferase [Minisyncoccia bacterium]
MAVFTNISIFSGLFISLFFEVFILITYFERKHLIKTESAKEPTYFPSTTIIVPCFNEEKTVAQTIESLLALDYPKDKFHIIAVDDGSSDKTLEVLSQYKNNPSVSVHSKRNGGKFTALNLGLSLTKSELVGCLDADSFVDSQALKRVVSYFDDKNTMAVTPSVVVYQPKNIIELIQKVEYTWGELLRKTMSFIGAVYVTPGPFSIFRSEVFKKLGGYKHAHHTEDFEIALRMHQSKFKIVNAHDALVYTKAPKTVRALIKQRTRWSYGFLNNMIDYKHMLFKKEYGHVSVYILPMAIISIFSSLFFFFTFLLSVGNKISEITNHILTVGISAPALNSFGWMMLNINSKNFLVMCALALSILLIFISRQLSEKSFKFSPDIVYFLLIYGFIVPFWLMKALYNTALGKSITWR